MSKQREWLVRAAVELGLRVSTEYTVTLPSGRQVRAEAFFPDLGTDRGMAVFTSPLAPELLAELRRGTHPASHFAAPGEHEQFDLDSYAEMFAEWGWSRRPDERPAWMIAFQRDDQATNDHFDAGDAA
jgi:hypothetical protein